MTFDWGELAFGSKKPLKELKAIFIAAPREISPARFTEIVKTYLPHGNIVLGIAKEDYILGFEDQLQFKTLRATMLQKVIDKVNTSKSPHKIATLSYFQRETAFILDKIPFKKALFVNGSWKHLFHSRPVYFTLTSRGIPYELISPFTDEAEAKAYEKKITSPQIKPSGTFTDVEMLEMAEESAKRSYDYGFQTGVALGRKKGKGYELLEWSFNKVVPYQTYAMLHGASRETNFSPMHDLNHYDTIHAEVDLMVKAQKAGLDLRGTTLFINLLPCPSCARMFTETDIAEFVYVEDHSDGYGFKMLTLAGKKVRRIVR
jgi:deoxycytidylate deaminase